MPSLYDLSVQISALIKQEKYQEALQLFIAKKENFAPESIAANPYLISSLLTALRKSGNFYEAFSLLEGYGIAIDENTHDIIFTAYGWLLYSRFTDENIEAENPDFVIDIFNDDGTPQEPDNDFTRSEVLGKIEAYMPLCAARCPASKYAVFVYNSLFEAVLRIEKAKQNRNWNFTKEFCELINPQFLSTRSETIKVTRKGVLKDLELASPLENWYATYTKSLFETENWNQCLDVSKKGLAAITSFHYGNDIWLARRIALSKQEMGNTDEAIAELEEILKRKKDWFIQKELADLYMATGHKDRAYPLALAAITNFGDLTYKVDVLYVLGQLLQEKNLPDLAYKHFSLSQILRILQDWPIPDKLSQALATYTFPYIPPADFEKIKAELQSFWHSHAPAPPKKKTAPDKELIIGKIDKILNQNDKGTNGFIVFNKDASIYFSLPSSNPLAALIRKDAEVKFLRLAAKEDRKPSALIKEIL